MREMKKVLTGIVIVISFFAGSLSAQISTKLQSIVPIAAYTATGDLQDLKSVLNEGLEAGLSVNEIKEPCTPVCLFWVSS